MGEKDKREKLFTACPDVFVELCNVLLYQGKHILTEDSVLPGPTETIYGGAKGNLCNQFQDYSMYEMRADKVQGFYTLENQSRQDRRMALRNAGYEGAAYRNQYHNRDDQGVYPVISLVLNWGEEPWEAATSIRELLAYSVPEDAWEYLNDNKVHVFDMRFLDKAVRERFEGDVRIVLDYLCDRESLALRRQKLRNPEEVLLMLHALSGDVQYLEWTETINERGEISMCDLLDEYWEKGLSRGFSQSIKNLMNSMKLSMEQAMEALMIPEGDRQKYADMLNTNGK